MGGYNFDLDTKERVVGELAGISVTTTGDRESTLVKQFGGAFSIPIGMAL